MKQRIIHIARFMAAILVLLGGVPDALGQQPLPASSSEQFVIEDDFKRQRFSGKEQFIHFPDLAGIETEWPRQRLFTNFRNDTLYFSIHLKNNSSQEEFVLSCESPGLPYIQIQQFAGDTLLSTYNDGLWSEEKRTNRLPDFHFRIAPGEVHQLFVKAHGDGFRMRVPVVLRTHEILNYGRAHEIVTFTVYYTILFLILITSFFVEPALQTSLRWPYVVYCLVLALNMAAIWGIGNQLIWFAIPAFQFVGEPLLVNLIFLAAIGYQRRLFRTARFSPSFDFLILLLTGLAFIATAITPFRMILPMNLIPYYQWGTFFIYNGVILVTIVLPLFQGFKLGFKESFFFFIASVWHALAFGLYSYENMGLVTYPANFFVSFWGAVSWLNFVMAMIILWRVNAKIQMRNVAGQEISEKKIKLIRELIIQDELERERVGADLHDEAGSRFASVKILLSGLLYEIEQKGVKNREADVLKSVIEEVDLLCQSNRALSHRLLSGSLQRLGIDDALTQLQQRLLQNGRFVSFQYPPLLFSGTGETFQYLVYRILEELVEEVFKTADHFRVRIDAIPGREALQIRAEGVDEPLPEPEQAILHELRTRVAVFNEPVDRTVILDEDVLELTLPILYS